jgi:hypothetical protein
MTNDTKSANDHDRPLPISSLVLLEASTLFDCGTMGTRRNQIIETLIPRHN